MAKVKEPFNISILKLEPRQLKFLPKVKSLSIRDPSTGNFHDDGFYSYTIFGNAGSEDRFTRFGTIECKVEILHPIIYDRLCRLKHLYGDILSGKAYAVWDEEKADFFSSDALTGSTGYAFFAQHVEKIRFKVTESPARDLRIKVVEDNMHKAMTRHILVAPAGIREIDIKEDGFEREQEVTELYRKFLAISNTIPEDMKDYNDPIYDGQRWSLQRTFNEIYDIFFDMFGGKKGVFQGRFGSRRTWNSTRNVISAIDPTTAVLGATNQPSCTAVQLGIYQLTKSVLPVTQHALRTGILAEIFGRDVGEVDLVDTQTLESTRVKIDPEDSDDFITWDGVERLCNSLADPGVRNLPVLVKGRYLALMYTTPTAFRIVRSITDIPEELRKGQGVDIHPITYAELIYLSGYRLWNRQSAMITRFPVSGTGSVIPLNIYARTTVKAIPRQELDSDFQSMGPDFIAWEYPEWHEGATFVETTIIPSCYLKSTGADFDGDTVAVNAVYSLEAVGDIKKAHRTRSFWVNGKNKLNIDLEYDTAAFMLRNLTGPR